MHSVTFFPTNGLDQTIHAPVLVGLVVLTFFAETLGWSFVGLVVPGYLTSVAIAAPVTAATIAAEAVLTYLLARTVGHWIPQSGAWSSSFGRERFFLIVAVSLVVRLVMEGVALPALAARWELHHAPELYSVGLVLIPLLANSFWNVGLWRGLCQSAVVTGLTYLFVQYLLLPHTNLSLSRFELVYESTAIDFLASAKAYLLLLSGTLIAAQCNVRYGWDYNGILVPGLLAVAWYSPLKLVTTFTEAVAVAYLARGVALVPPLSRMVIEGPRRTLLVFVVGFAVKMLMGFAGMAALPGESVIELYGFGYVLPTLVAVKINQRATSGRVVVPALLVSFAGFAVGNGLGFLLHLAWPESSQSRFASLGGVDRSESLAYQLTLQSSWPVQAGPVPRPEELLPTVRRMYQAVLQGTPGSMVEELRQQNLRLHLAHGSAGARWWMLTGPPHDAEAWARLPVIAFSEDPQAVGIVAVWGEPGNPAVALADGIAQANQAAFILVWPQPPDQAGGQGERWLEELSRTTGQGGLATVVHRRGQGATVTLLPGPPGAVPALQRSLATPFERRRRRWVARLDEAQLARLAADLIAAEAHLLQWQRSFWPLAAMTSSPAAPLVGAEARPDEEQRRWPQVSVRALRLFSAVVAPPLLAWPRQPRPPTRFAAAVARRLGFEYVVARDGDGESLALVPLDANAGAVAFRWIARPEPWHRAVASAEPLCRGGMQASWQLVAAATSAAHLVAGDCRAAHRRCSRRPPAARTYYLRAQELLLAAGVELMVVRGMPGRYDTTGLVLSTGEVVRQGVGKPVWAQEVQASLAAAGFPSRWYDGSAQVSPFRGTTEPALVLSRYLARQRAVLVWVDGRTRSAMDTSQAAEAGRRLHRAGYPVAEGDVALHLVTPLPGRRAGGRCDVAAVRAGRDRYLTTGNPWSFEVMAALAKPCAPRALRDDTTGAVYLLLRDGHRRTALRVDHRGTGERLVQTGPAARQALLARSGVITLREPAP